MDELIDCWWVPFQVFTPINNQDDLDQAIALLNRNDRLRSLRLLLKQPQTHSAHSTVSCHTQCA